MTNKYTAHNLKNAAQLLTDLNLLLSSWDENRSADENLDLAIRRNIFGKTSRSRVAELVRIFRHRYLPKDGSARAFRMFVGSTLPAEVTDRVVYYYTALAEPLVYDFVTEYLFPHYLQGKLDIDIKDVLDFFNQDAHRDKGVQSWTESTREQAGQGLLSTLRDLGVLAGVVHSKHKTLAPKHLHVLAFAYIVFHIKRTEPSGEKIIHHPHWRLFFLRTSDVERYFAEADAEKLLTYQAAGSIIRIEFPTTDFEEYVNALITRTF